MKQILLLSFLFICNFLHAQLFFTENFESAPAQYTPDANIQCISSDYFCRTDGTNPPISANGSADYSNVQGSFYWAGESHDDVVNGSPGTCNVGNGEAVKRLVFNSIDISSLTQPDILFSALFGGNEVSNSLEGEEFVEIRYSFDNVNFTTLMSFTPVENVPSAGLDQLCLDGNSSNCIGQAMQTFTAQFAKGANTTLYLVVAAGNDSSSEEWAIDNITLTNVAALPVELISFKGKIIGESSKLEWETASELNNSGFEIQKSKDGREWDSIEFVNGMGTSTEFNRYEFIDYEPINGISYYRLKQIDYDGNFEFSDVVSINFIDNSKVKIYPNPSSDRINISGIEEGEIIIFDNVGREVKRVNFVNTEINISDLSTGFYSVQIISNNKTTIKKLIKE